MLKCERKKHNSSSGWHLSWNEYCFLVVKLLNLLFSPSSWILNRAKMWYAGPPYLCVTRNLKNLWLSFVFISWTFWSMPSDSSQSIIFKVQFLKHWTMSSTFGFSYLPVFLLTGCPPSLQKVWVFFCFSFYIFFSSSPHKLKEMICSVFKTGKIKQC